ncbi:mechanosensitive ion channel family protein [Microvirga brassicacearum]|uniref:Mechanosensitive ion channel family protein n=2 Tax=Microvirga brassicacearum TaxID=2580413 RepID=A0A5N3PB21_9HYPH|nr:mechanosensitive ion channel family protein [Microvirga brassicacearum]
MLAGTPAADAQTTSAQSSPPPQVQQLLNLLQDPAVRGWIDQQQQPAPALAGPPPSASEMTASEMMAARTASLREHLASLAAAAPRLPSEFRNAADRLLAELRGRRLVGVLILVLGFVALGAGTELIFRKVTARPQRRIVTLPSETPSDRMRAIGLRLAFGLSEVAIFGLGSIGAFLAFDWPPLLRQVVLAYLIAAVILRLVLVLGRFLLAPDGGRRQDTERFRVVPLSADAALFWFRRLAFFVGWFAFGRATLDVLSALGFSPEARELVAYTLGLGLLAIALNVVWARPAASDALPDATRHTARHAVAPWLLSLCLVLLWGFWVVGFMRLFWLLAIALLLPAAIMVARTASHHVFRPVGGSEAPSAPSLMAIYLDRGIRALLIVGAAFLLAHTWHIDLVEMTGRDTLLTRLLRGALSSIVILLVADLIWQVLKSLIDRRLARAEALSPPGTEAAVKQARLRTLLPIFRNVILVVLVAVAAMMALSALGVEIGPLIAGAGIVGVAIGFGSQTLVKDVFSGVFYLLDDAFRVGEYIQSGSYKGTVESFGFRSVKLRHHRGPLSTVPYGVLGAVQNMSRDWVIDKVTVGVAYDSDFEKAKKLIKQIGKELAEDPELAPHIIEPLKMQGVEQFSDYGIQIRLKMMTKPGEQFVIRRRALAMIKQAFDENGIRFAIPTVQVAGHEEAGSVAAHQALKLVKPPTPE